MVSPRVQTSFDLQKSVVSMFSGCGGMDLGFKGGFRFLGRQYDRLPFEIIWANDNNEAACKTYRANVGSEIICGDVWEVLDSIPENPDVLIGGFPCQDISINGKRNGVEGKRSGLYKAMVDAIMKKQPSIFIAENVKGLLLKHSQKSLRWVLRDFGSLGYNVTSYLFMAADFGVPQTRERFFIVGTHKKLPKFRPPAKERNEGDWITAEEAIGDLETVAESKALNHIWSRAKVSAEQGNRRLVAERPGYTIRSECHGNIQFHYRLPRRISMREAARIQSFPDEFIFQSALRETERQVGNAVPPVLAWHIANATLACLIERDDATASTSVQACQLA